MYHKEALPNGCTTANTSVTSITSACSPLSTAPQAGLVSGKLIAGSLSASRELPCPSLFIDEPLNIQKLVVILPPKWPFNIWRGKSEVLLRAGHFHKSMTFFPNPRQGKRPEKKISRLRRGFSYTPPAPVRTGAVSRILQSSTKFHKYENTEYRHYISLHRTAGFDDQS